MVGIAAGASIASHAVQVRWGFLGILLRRIRLRGIKPR
jgi:hypothetical protein